MDIPKPAPGVYSEREPTNHGYRLQIMGNDRSELFLRVLARYPTKNVSVIDLGHGGYNRTVVYDAVGPGFDTVGPRWQIGLLPAYIDALQENDKEYGRETIREIWDGGSVYSSVDQMRRFLTPAVHSKCRFAVLPLGLYDVRFGGHANVVVVQRIEQPPLAPYYLVERWDPHTERALDPPTLDEHLSRFFKEVFHGLGYSVTYCEQPTTCSAESMSLQTIAEDSCEKLKTVRVDGGFCALWTLMFMMMRVHGPNQNLSSKQVTQHLKDWVRKDPEQFCDYSFEFLRQVFFLDEVKKQQEEEEEEPSTKRGRPRKPCAPHQYRNPATGRCKKKKTAAAVARRSGRPRKPCAAHQYRNPATGRCKKKTAAAATQPTVARRSGRPRKPCASHQYRNPATGRCKKKNI